MASGMYRCSPCPGDAVSDRPRCWKTLKKLISWRCTHTVAVKWSVNAHTWLGSSVITCAGIDMIWWQLCFVIRRKHTHTQKEPILHAHTTDTTMVPLCRGTWGSVPSSTEDTSSWQRAEAAANGLLINLNQMTFRQKKTTADSCLPVVLRRANLGLVRALNHIASALEIQTNVEKSTTSQHGELNLYIYLLHMLIHTCKHTPSRWQVHKEISVSSPPLLDMHAHTHTHTHTHTHSHVPVESIFICCVWEQPWDSTLFSSISHPYVSRRSSLALFLYGSDNITTTTGKDMSSQLFPYRLREEIFLRLLKTVEVLPDLWFTQVTQQYELYEVDG